MKSLSDDQKQVETTDRREVLRPERLQVEQDKCLLIVNGHAYEVADINEFGVAIVVNNCGDFPGRSIGAALRYDDILVGTYELVKVRESQVDSSRKIVALRTDSIPIDMNFISGIRLGLETASRIADQLGAYSLVPPKFKQNALEIKEELETVAKAVGVIEDQLVMQDDLARRRMEEGLISVISRILKDRFDTNVLSLSQSLAQAEASAIKASYEYFRRTFSELIYLSPFSKRSLEKPLGYAGDYQLMHMLYANENIGKTLFGRAFHRYVIEMPGGNAVRNREELVRSEIKVAMKHKAAEKLRIMSIACGPAREIVNLINESSQEELDNIEVVLLDQDIQALKFAQKSIREALLLGRKSLKVVYLPQNIRNVITRGINVESCDLIYSAGLFDYFSDPVATMAASKLYDSLRSGGMLLIGNFDISSKSRFFMELAWDWNLVYRNRQDLERLFGHIGRKHEIVIEPENINLFIKLWK